jgi:hypothetical protein
MADPAIRKIYDWATKFRGALGDPNILANDGFWETVSRYGAQYERKDYGDVVEAMPAGPAKDAAVNVEDLFNTIGDAPEADTNDNQWKSANLDSMKQALDAFIATDPAPPPQDAEMAGGKKRRKTRKSKGKSRRARYSRRR